MKVKPNLPNIDPNGNTQINRGVRGQARGKGALPQSHGTRANSPEPGLLGKNNFGGKQGNLNSLKGFETLGSLLRTALAGNTNVGINANSPGFSLGLNQNLQLTIQFLFESLPPDAAKSLQNFSPSQIVSALLLSGGILNQLEGGQTSESRTLSNEFGLLKQIFSLLSSTDTSNLTPQDIKNLWNLATSLLNGSGSAKTVADLELLGQKYVKLINSVDLQTLVKLAELAQKGQNQTGQASGKANQFLTTLLSNGENLAIKNAQLANLALAKANGSFGAEFRPAVPQNIVQADKVVNQATLFGGANRVLTEEKNIGDRKEFYSDRTEIGLRKQLDFYPHYAYDRQISMFQNSTDISLGQEEFVNSYYSEIEDWLKTGKHRLVKDFAFDRPIGMVVDRGDDGFITANKVRVVLVRDGSVEGWHFLRSFLVS